MNYPLLLPRRLTVEKFREMELNAPENERWELIDGRIVKSMASGTLRHNKIVLNIVSTLRNELNRRGSPCETFAQNVRLDRTGSAISTLPDVVVTCNPPSDNQSSIVDAAAIFEVLSPSRASTDLNEKLSAYLKLPGLRFCAFVEQALMSVVSYTRSSDDWLRRELDAADQALTIDGLDVSITLDQIYDRVDLKQSAR